MTGGRVPKLPEQRRNRAVLRAGEWVRLPSSGRKGRVPPIPGGVKLTRETRDWWIRIWHSPPALMWHSADVYCLLDLAILREQFIAGHSALAGEIRLRENSLGLTPAGRQSLRWLIVDDADTEPPDDLAERRR